MNRSFNASGPCTQEPKRLESGTGHRRACLDASWRGLVRDLATPRSRGCFASSATRARAGRQVDVPGDPPVPRCSWSRTRSLGCSASTSIAARPRELGLRPWRGWRPRGRDRDESAGTARASRSAWRSASGSRWASSAGSVPLGRLRDGDVNLVLALPLIDRGGGALAGGVGVVGEDDPLGEVAHEAKVLFAECGAARRDGARQPGA